MLLTGCNSKENRQIIYFPDSYTKVGLSSPCYALTSMHSLKGKAMKISNDQKYIILGFTIFVGAPIVYAIGVVWWALSLS